MVTLRLDEGELKALRRLLRCVCVLQDYAFWDAVGDSETQGEVERLKRTFEKVCRKVEKMSEMVTVVVSEACQTGDCDCMQYYKMTTHRQCTDLLPPYHEGCTCYAVTQTGERIERGEGPLQISTRPLATEESAYRALWH